jgi:hypothetical protein
MSPSTSAFSLRTNASTWLPTRAALAPTDFSERKATHFGCVRRCREVVLYGAPLRPIIVPVAHHLVHATTVQAAGQAADVIIEWRWNALPGGGNSGPPAMPAM